VTTPTMSDPRLQLRESLAQIWSDGYITVEPNAFPGVDLELSSVADRAPATRPSSARSLADPGELARAADNVRALDPLSRPSGAKASELYAELLGAEAEPVQLSPQQQAALTSARQLLFADAKGRIPSRMYAEYQRWKEALAAARQSGGSGQAEWLELQLLAPGRIEEALALLDRHAKNDTGVVLAAARASFETGRSEDALGAYFTCTSTPSDFWSAPSEVSTIEVGDLVWELTRVVLRRPWFDRSLLTRSGLHVLGREPGAFSNGSADASNRGIFPLLARAFFVAWTGMDEARIVAWEHEVIPYFPHQRTGSNDDHREITR
jgi:hypothetical protein